MDEAQKEKLMATCSCGSGKKYGECCGKEEMGQKILCKLCVVTGVRW